jgi:hypothetical protein
MAAYSDDGDDDYAYDSDAALDSDDDASALLEDEVRERAPSPIASRALNGCVRSTGRLAAARQGQAAGGQGRV